jgi:uncharacterized alpha-E superfamily protein
MSLLSVSPPLSLLPTPDKLAEQLPFSLLLLSVQVVGVVESVDGGLESVLWARKVRAVTTSEMWGLLAEFSWMHMEATDSAWYNARIG